MALMAGSGVQVPQERTKASLWPAGALDVAMVL